MSVIGKWGGGGSTSGDSGGGGGASSVFGKYRVTLSSIRKPSLIPDGTVSANFGSSPTGYKRYLASIVVYADNDVNIGIESYVATDDTGRFYESDGDWVPLFRTFTGTTGARIDFMTMFGALQDISQGLNSFSVKNYSTVDAVNLVVGLYFVDVPI